MYFNGVQEGKDVGSGEDRWTMVTDGTKKPLIYGKPVRRKVRSFSVDKHYVVIHYKNRNIERI